MPAARRIRRAVRRRGDRRARAATSAWFEVVVDGGRTPTGRDAIVWAREAERRGAGEMLVTSIDRDGTRAGFDLPLLRAMRAAVDLPIIASGGAGTAGATSSTSSNVRSDAALAASLFHYGELAIAAVKRELAAHGFPCAGPVAGVDEAGRT